MKVKITLAEASQLFLGEATTEFKYIKEQVSDFADNTEYGEIIIQDVKTDAYYAFDFQKNGFYGAMLDGYDPCEDNPDELVSLRSVTYEYK